jgi:hypothetical protein
LLFILLFAVTFLFAQKTTDVPKAVTDRMLTLFPQANTTPVTWEKNGFNYRGTLDNKERNGAAVIDSTGKIIQTERKINPKNLPDKSRKALAAQYKEFEVIDLWAVSDDKAKSSFKATVQIKEVILFDKDGALISPKK